MENNVVKVEHNLKDLNTGDRFSLGSCGLELFPTFKLESDVGHAEDDSVHKTQRPECLGPSEVSWDLKNQPECVVGLYDNKRCHSEQVKVAMGPPIVLMDVEPNIPKEPKKDDLRHGDPYKHGINEPPKVHDEVPKVINAVILLKLL